MSLYSLFVSLLASFALSLGGSTPVHSFGSSFYFLLASASLCSYLCASLSSPQRLGYTPRLPLLTYRLALSLASLVLFRLSLLGLTPFGNLFSSSYAFRGSAVA